MATRIQVRQGNLSELPILAPGEQGYALDANRLFIGNEPLLLGEGDGSTLTFSIPNDSPIDLDILPIYKVRINGMIVNPSQFSVLKDGKQIKFLFTEPSQYPQSNEQVDIVYNTELLTYIPDREVDPVSIETLVSTGGTLTDFCVDPARYDSGEIKYTIRCTLNQSLIRTGTITFTVSPNNTCYIDDRYITSDDDALSYEFSMILENGLYKISHGGGIVDRTFSYVTNFWKS